MKIQTLLNEIKFSNHCQLRIAQRGINEKAIMQVLAHGEIIHKQGLKFHHLPKAKCKKIQISENFVKDLMVITNLARTEVITCYKNPKAVHEVKKKPKRLSKYPLN